MYTTYNKIFSAGGLVVKAHREKDFIYLLLFYFFWPHSQNILVVLDCIGDFSYTQEF